MRKSKFNIKEGEIYEERLVVRVFHRYPNKSGHRSAIFRCSCGKDFERTLSNQRRSVFKVCNSCTNVLTANLKVKYDDKRHNRQLYGIWKSMNSRCHKEYCDAYPNYGGRGISVCKEWRDTDYTNYYNFLDHVYPRPSNEHSLERVDNNKGYCPENVKWAKQDVQMNNVRTNHVIVFEGNSYTLTQLAEKFQIKANTLLYRLRRGWSLEEAIKGERLKEYSPSLLKKVDEHTLYTVMCAVKDGSITQEKAGLLIGVDSSNISRTVRNKDFIEWMKEYEDKL